ncbi:MAG: hypothetical protein WC313_01020 [Candidatus Kapaibacterium sp.]|jgi:hypothetical protein
MDEVIDNNGVEFTQDIDFYWRSIAVYSIVLIVYSTAFGSIIEGKFEINASNPVVLLLLIIIIGTTISLLYRISRKRAIVVGRDYIIFKSRFKEKKYHISQIKSISFAKERIFRTRRKFSIVKFRVNSRKLMLRLRPSSFDDETLMIRMLQNLAREIK